MTHLSPNTGLAVTQHTNEPFVFRSGGLFHSGKQVKSIHSAIKHMDRYPEDGIYHLRNGTLAQWLDDQGAEDLAKLAREVVRKRETDPRVTLETFLIGTGLVRRPQLSLRPKAIAVPFILSGQKAECLLRVRKGRGRGYLYGGLSASQPWLRVDPARFSGKPLESVVSVGTEALPISNTPHSGTILVDSSATEQPMPIPVRFRVVGVPSSFHRYVVRPLMSLLLAGILGCILGALMGISGIGFPMQPLKMLSLNVTAIGAWAILIGLVWGIFGAVLGFAQPLAWPVWYANGRWLLRTVIWAATLTVLVAIGLIAWRVAYPNGHLALPRAEPGRYLADCHGPIHRPSGARRAMELPVHPGKYDPAPTAATIAARFVGPDCCDSWNCLGSGHSLCRAGVAKGRPGADRPKRSKHHRRAVGAIRRVDESPGG